MESINSKEFSKSENFKQCNESCLEFCPSKNSYSFKIIDYPQKNNNQSKLENFIQNAYKSNSVNKDKIKTNDKLAHIASCGKFSIQNNLNCNNATGKNKTEIKYDDNYINKIKINSSNKVIKNRKSDNEIKNDDKQMIGNLQSIYPNTKKQPSFIKFPKLNKFIETDGTIYNNDGDSLSLSEKEKNNNYNESNSKFLNFDLLSDKDLLSEILDITKLTKIYSDEKLFNSNDDKEKNDDNFNIENSNLINHKSVNKVVNGGLNSYISQLKNTNKNNIIKKEVLIKNDNTKENSYDYNNNNINYGAKSSLSDIISSNVSDNNNDYNLGKIKYKEYGKNDILNDKNKSIIKNKKYIKMKELLSKINDINLRNQILSLFLSSESIFNTTSQSKNSINYKDNIQNTINSNTKKGFRNCINEDLVICQNMKINILPSDKKEKKNYNNVIKTTEKGAKVGENTIIHYKIKEFKKKDLENIKNMKTNSSSKDKAKKNDKNNSLLNSKDIFLFRLNSNKSSKNGFKNNFSIKSSNEHIISKTKNLDNYIQNAVKNKIRKSSSNNSYYKSKLTTDSKNNDNRQKLTNCKTFLVKKINSTKRKLLKEYDSYRKNEKIDFHNSNLHLRRKINEYNMNKSKEFILKNDKSKKIDFSKYDSKSFINTNNSFNNKKHIKTVKSSNKIGLIDISLEININKIKKNDGRTLTQRINNNNNINSGLSRNDCKVKLTTGNTNVTMNEKPIKVKFRDESNSKPIENQELPVHYIYMNKTRMCKFSNMSNKALNIKKLKYENYLKKILNLKEILVNLNLIHNTTIYDLIKKVEVSKVFCCINKGVLTIYQSIQKMIKLDEIRIDLIDKITVIKVDDNFYGFILVINFCQNYVDKNIGFAISKEIVLNEIIDTIDKIIPNVEINFIHI